MAEQRIFNPKVARSTRAAPTMTSSLRPRVILNAPSVKIAAAYGRIYASGSHAHLLRNLPGAREHERTRSIQLSLTLDTLRAIRRTLHITKEQMATYCTDEVLRWARAAGTQERAMLALHERIRSGYRAELPWLDTRAGTEAPENAAATQTELAQAHGGVIRVWKHRPPFEHQRVMATVAAELDGCAFLCEPGTGKTRAAIESMRAKMAAGVIDVFVVVCPKSVMGTWERECRWWAPDLRPVLLRGRVADRIETMRVIAQRGVLFVLNYETLADMQEAVKELTTRFRLMFVPDEMHKLKNPQAQQSAAAMEIARHAHARLGQTGTPVANGAQDVWSQWYVVDLGQTFGANFVQFRSEFFTEYSWSWSIDPQEGSLDRIGQKLRLRGLRYRKEDCFDLPPKVYEVEEVEMGREQRTAYEQMKAHLVAWLRGEVQAMPGDADDDDGPANADGRRATAANQLVAMLRLTQITSGFVGTDEGTVHAFEPNPKLKRCEEIVREQVRHGRQVIVWARYTRDIEGLLDALRDLACVRIDGTQQGARGETERALAESMFQSGSARVMVANPAAGGVGLNLQAASVAIYYSQDCSYLNRSQSEDRCHRSGSEVHNKVLYIDMLCEDSIDFTVRDILMGKKDTASAVVDLRRAIGA